MAFTKAGDLLQLAMLVAGRRYGITLDDVAQRFGCSIRTARRMFRALEDVFPDVEAAVDDDGRKRWRMARGPLDRLMTISAEELADFDLAIRALQREGQAVEAARLIGLRDKIKALLPPTQARRIAADEEALLAAQGFVARPGPRRRVRSQVVRAVGEAIKACRILEVLYRSRQDEAPRKRLIAPHGVLTGVRRYVAAKDQGDLWEPMKLYRLDALEAAAVTDEAFVFDPAFDLQAFADRAFGVFQNEAEFGEVVWRFAPAAAAHARGFDFHPNQVVEDEPDGSLLVRFEAAGHLEMCWYLYAWGDQVEVVAPDRLRRLCEGFQRSDFPALP